MDQLSFRFQLFGSVLRHFSTLRSFRPQITLFLDKGNGILRSAMSLRLFPCAWERMARFERQWSN